MKTISQRYLAMTAALILISVLLTVATLGASELTVVTSGAFTAAFQELAPRV